MPDGSPRMASILAYQSSEIDWCESNFQHSEVVAEFYNTISNVTFFIFGPLMMYLLHPYAQKRSLYVHCVWILFMVVGAFSVYFHMTLSFLGQLLDEISILWLLAAGYSIWLPRSYFPAFLKEDRSRFTRMVLITTVVSTLLAFIRPVVNAYVLNGIGLHIIYVVTLEYRKTSSAELKKMVLVSLAWWFLAVVSWLSDRLLCAFWQRISFFYLHSIWHVLISITFPHSVALMVCVDVHYEMPQYISEIHYWPKKSWPVGLPYVVVRDRKEPEKNC
ncbi:alkaline ceramidase 1 [Tachyglossus aculeatus]|uniref:alkaline ceramidase 1 n=1 Tax=Tachyglossus aculeatus TaxID=9261 RepID=UPI0018F29EE1|nr:alkaline ceramidase 1 [Tachyglossus aculeatus]